MKMHIQMNCSTKCREKRKIMYNIKHSKLVLIFKFTAEFLSAEYLPKHADSRICHRISARKICISE